MYVYNCICVVISFSTSEDILLLAASAHQEQQTAVQTTCQALFVNCALLAGAGHVIVNAPEYICYTRVPALFACLLLDGRSVGRSFGHMHIAGTFNSRSQYYAPLVFIFRQVAIFLRSLATRCTITSLTTLLGQLVRKK